MPTSQYGPSKDWNNITLASKPFLVVSPGGPDDGGDYGPNIPGTTTGGIQEALNALPKTGGTVLIAPGPTGLISTTITPPLDSAVLVAQGATLNWSANTTWNSTTPSIKIVNNNIAWICPGIAGIEASNQAPVIPFIDIDDTNQFILFIKFEGFFIGSQSNTTQSCVLFNQPNNSNGIGSVTFRNCGFAGTVQVTNASSGAVGSPTQVYFQQCMFNGGSQTSPSIHADMIGQWFFSDCTFVTYASSTNIFQFDGNNAVSEQSNTVQMSNTQWVINSGFTGSTFLSVTNNASIADFIVEGMYLEDNSPALLLNVGAAGGDASGEMNIAFRDILGFTGSGITLMDISGGVAITSQSLILFDHITSAYKLPALGTFGLGAAYLADYVAIHDCKGLPDTGMAPVQCSVLQKAETSADASLLTFSGFSIAGTYKLKISMDVSAENTYTLFGWTATWTDSNGHAQAPTYLSLYQSGVAAPALNFTPAANGHYYGGADVDINNSGTSIVIKTTGSGTSIAYKASAWIERVQ